MSDPKTWISAISFLPSLLLSVLSLAISFLSFWRTRPYLQLKRDQKAQMVIVASRATVLWDQLETITQADLNNDQIESYLYPSMRANARRLEDSIDKAIGLGLFTDLVGDLEISLPLYTAFVQSLFHAFSDESAKSDVWTKLHLRMGMVRLIESCKRYDSNLKSRLKVPLPSFSWETIETSHTYIIDLHSSSD